MTLPPPPPIPEKKTEEPPPGETEPPEETEPPDGWDIYNPCAEHPLVCGALLPVLFCIAFPEICALPGFCAAFPWLCTPPEWPDGGEDEPEEPEPEEEPECGDPTLPATQVEFIPPSGDKGNAIEARPLTRCPGNTRGSPAKRDDNTWPHGWECISAIRDEWKFWARAHLLHHGLHGPGNDRRNIIISDKSINRQMESDVEGNAVRRTRQNRVLWYEVEVNHFTGPYPRPYFAESVHMAWGEMDPLTGLATSTEYDDTIASGTNRQPPPCESTPEEPGPTPEEPTITPPEPVPEEPTPAQPEEVDGCPLYANFPFGFDIQARLPRSRSFHVPEGASVTVTCEAHYDQDVEDLAVRPGTHYYIKLHGVSSSSATAPLLLFPMLTVPGAIVIRSIEEESARYVVGARQVYTWSVLDAGCYYMEIWKDEPGGFSPFHLIGEGTVDISALA